MQSVFRGFAVRKALSQVRAVTRIQVSVRGRCLSINSRNMDFHCFMLVLAPCLNLKICPDIVLRVVRTC